MLTCDEVVPKLPEFARGSLEATETEQIRAHLKGCKACPRVRLMFGIVVLQERSMRPKRLADKTSPLSI